MAPGDPAEARLRILSALKEEFMDILDEGSTDAQQLAQWDSDMTAFAADIMDAFGFEVITVRGDDVFDVRLQIPKYVDSPEEPAA